MVVTDPGGEAAAAHPAPRGLLEAGAVTAGAGTTELVVCSLEGWDDVWRRNQFLVRELLARDDRLRVLFVEPAIDLAHELRRRRLPRRLGVRPVPGHPRLWALRPLRVLPGRLGAASDRGLCRQVRRAARRLGLASPTLWVNDAVYAPLAARAGWPSLYDITDDWLLAQAPPAESRRRQAREEALLAGAGAVVVCSPALAASRGTTREVRLIPNGVDVEHFRRPTSRPPDLPPGPNAVYVGTLHDERVDVDLVVELAQGLDPRGVVLVGPNCLSDASVRRLSQIANVHLLGPRPYQQVPAYLQHADVVVVPHLVTSFTESLDPIKAYECQVVPTPTVATEAAGFRELRSTWVRCVPRARFVEEVLATMSCPPRSAPAAAPPGWAARADDFATVLDGVRRR